MDSPPIINAPAKLPSVDRALLGSRVFGLPFALSCYLGITRFP